MTVIALAPEPTSAGSTRRTNPPASPSFEIRGAVGVSVSAPRWDRINSAEVISRARRLYYAFLEANGSGQEPSGVVIAGAGGRVVFEAPVLLPDEQYIPIEIVRGRTGRSRTPRNPYRG